jgi:ribonuclease HII
MTTGAKMSGTIRRSARVAGTREKAAKRAELTTIAALDAAPEGERSRSIAPAQQQGSRSTAAATSSGTARTGALSRVYEQNMLDNGFKFVAGVDEAGRGPLCGPVVAAAVVMPPTIDFDGINDSKQLDQAQRETLYDQIVGHPLIKWSTAFVDVGTIDRINILQATMLAMEQAVGKLDIANPNELAILVDGNRLPKSFDTSRSQAIVKGDSKCISIAAASILAKVTRDRYVQEHLHPLYPVYNFGTWRLMQAHTSYPLFR